jgi:choline dehydrogenase-like flavoprotein
MKIEDLASFDANSVFEADLVIVGGGPAGLTIAREFFGTSIRVLVLESGLVNESAEHGALAELESIGDPRTDAQKHKRIAFHGAGSRSWQHEQQPYGVRCRALGGSTHAWAGKSAAFEPIDFAERPWVPYSGWPITRDALASHLDRAADVLNLGPNVYDENLWKLIGMAPPKPQIDEASFGAFFWQFARSRIDHLDVMRFGAEFVTFKADNARVLLNATVTEIGIARDGRNLDELKISTIDGVRSRVKAKIAVLAASAIENARLLLASNAVHSNGIGNANHVVGRFLMDHPGARIARFDAKAMESVARRFGFYGVRHDGRMQMYMHGLALTPAVQEREELLNAAIYFMGERSLDDPLDALKRLLRRTSDEPVQDMISVASSAGWVAKGIGTKILASDRTPRFLKDLIVNGAILFDPNLVAEEFQSRGLQHKLTGLAVDAITEQPPNPDSRVSLSDKVDQLGVPLARVDWRIGDAERRTLVRIAELARDAFLCAGLPEPVLEPWVAERRPQDSIIIDMAHTAGTTRMSDNPRSGVVDSNCRIHGVDGLYVAGASIFPTSGHANPTLMILALAIRLADEIKRQLAE